MPSFAYLRALAVRLQWRRGLRAAIAVAAAIFLCQAFAKPFGWAALGAFEATLVDNGGPYRSRLVTILTVLTGGALAGILGSIFGALLYNDPTLPREFLAILATSIICFAFTFARVLTQPIASTSVIILVLYFAGFGSAATTLTAASTNVAFYIAGGLAAAALSLLLWPLDPFRPARLGVAAVYAQLAVATSRLASPRETQTGSESESESEDHDWKRQLRIQMEQARIALGQTAARTPARTLRGHNLAVLLETADLLFVHTIRFTEFDDLLQKDDTGPNTTLQDTAQWLAHAQHAIADALQHAPADSGASFATDGSHTIQLLHRRTLPSVASTKNHHLIPFIQNEEREAHHELEIAFEALHAIWSGTSPTSFTQPLSDCAEPAPTPSAIAGLLENARAEWSLRSTMLRHALRMAAVAAADVLIMRLLHISHGFWLAMTSIIVLQPSGSGTMRRSLQRVGGTVAGGLFAAALTAVIHSQTGILIVLTLCAGLCLASFAIDYGLYSFFLTPTFVLLSLPHLRDWRYAGIRIVTTALGALVSVLAMRLLWPQREHRELTRLLESGAHASAAYLRALLELAAKPTADRQRRLTQARRACGLTSNTAEDALDSLLLQPSFTRKSTSTTEQALAFTTYLRRFTQSVTTLAALTLPTATIVANPETSSHLESLASRLESLSKSLAASSLPPSPPTVLPQRQREEIVPDLAALQIQRMDRQVAILERTAFALLGSAS